MTKETKMILILTSQRCGSTLLLELIGNNIINLEYESEIFSFFGEMGKKKENISDSDLSYLNDFKENGTVLSYLNDLKENCSSEFFMFKLMYNQMNHELIDLIKSNYFDYIIDLQRKNIIDTFISHQKMNELGEFKNYDTTNFKIKFDTNQYIEYRNNINEKIKYLDLKRKHLNEINQSIIHYEYNELFDINKVINKLNNLIPELKKSEEEEVVVKTQKQDLSVDYKDKIINYNECKEFIENELKTFDN